METALIILFWLAVILAGIIELKRGRDDIQERK